MYIKYDQYEMMELFNSEPIKIGDDESGELIYTYKDDTNFSVILFMSIYEKTGELTLTYQDKVVFNSEIKGINYIKKIENSTAKQQL